MITLRIQRKRIKDWRNPKGTIYVGRPTYYGNPYVAGENGVETVSQAVALYAQHRLTEYSNDDLAELCGHNLACWCKLCPIHVEGKPFDVMCADCDPCHVDVLGPLANP